MKPNKCFIRTQHYAAVLKSNCPFDHTQYSSGLISYCYHPCLYVHNLALINIKFYLPFLCPQN